MIRQMTRRPMAEFIAFTAALAVISPGTRSLAAARSASPLALAASVESVKRASSPSRGVVEIFDGHGQPISVIDSTPPGTAAATDRR